MSLTLRKKKCLVTGGAGFLGSHMCDMLLSKGARVVCLDNLSNGKRENIAHLKHNDRFVFYRKDVNNRAHLQAVFQREKPDYVMHYAAMVGVKRTSDDPLGVFADVEGIKYIAELCRQHQVKKILFTSSSEVYGEPVKLPIAEDDAFNSRWPYGLVKILGEQYFQAYQEVHGIPVTIVRFFNVYGPRQDFGDSGFVVSVFLNNALQNKSLAVYGDGAQTRDFVYIDDNIRLTLKAFCSSKLNGRPVNIGSGKSICVRDLAHEIQVLLPQTNVVYKAPRRKGEIRYRTPDVSFMKKMLHDEPCIDLSDGLQKTLTYLRTHKRRVR